MAANNVRVQGGGAAAMRKKKEEFVSAGKEEFWMRDPKTGNWIPESQFNQIDVAELREQLITKKEL